MDLKQWIQMDTSQDASYYGNWCNPHLKATISYCEGDICVTLANTDENFLKVILGTRKWNFDNGWTFSLDAGFNPNKETMEFIKKYEEAI
jgi:hypothetical protein